MNLRETAKTVILITLVFLLPLGTGLYFYFAMFTYPVVVHVGDMFFEESMYNLQPPNVITVRYIYVGIEDIVWSPINEITNGTLVVRYGATLNYRSTGSRTYLRLAIVNGSFSLIGRKTFTIEHFDHDTQAITLTLVE